jgi:glutathione peroxidase
MKIFFGFFVAIALCAFSYIDDIYSITINSIDGKKIDLTTYKGKKILFVVCPLSPADTTLSLSDLAALQAKYESSLQVIGIVAGESGTKQPDIAGLKKLYKDQRPNFILTAGMKIKKSAGAEQSPLLQWLTNKDKNKHFNQDVKGVGHKFFVDEHGELYAVFGPQLKLSNPIIDRVLSKPLVRK